MNSILESIEILEALVESRFGLKKRSRATPEEKKDNKEHYRKNKSEVKKKNRKWNRSAKGRKWKRLKERFGTS